MRIEQYKLTLVILGVDSELLWRKGRQIFITTQAHIFLEIISILEGGKMKHFWWLHYLVNIMQIHIYIKIRSIYIARTSYKGELFMLSFGEILWFRSCMNWLLINTNQCISFYMQTCYDPTDPNREMGFITDNVNITSSSLWVKFYYENPQSHVKISGHMSINSYVGLR